MGLCFNNKLCTLHINVDHFESVILLLSSNAVLAVLKVLLDAFLNVLSNYWFQQADFKNELKNVKLASKSLAFNMKGENNGC